MDRKAGGFSRREGSGIAGWIGIFVITVLITGGTFIGDAAHAATRRAVLGTVVASTTLQIETEPGVWTTGSQGTPVLEESALRNGAGRRAMVALGKDGVLGIGENSSLRIGSLTSERLPVSIEGESTISFRLPRVSTLELLTDVAIMKAPVDLPDSDSEQWIQGTLTQRASETIVRISHGSLDVRNRDGSDFITLHSGEEATITAKNEKPRIAAMTPASSSESGSWFGTKSALAAAGATAVAVAGSLGGAAAAGSFDGGGGGTQAAESGANAPPASPFRP